MKSFQEFLVERLDAGGFTTEDVLSCFLPLVRQVVGDHEAGRVAPLVGLEDLHVEANAIWYEAGKSRGPTTKTQRLRALDGAAGAAVEIVHERRRAAPGETPGGGGAVVDLRIGVRGQEVERPVYLPGYVVWEHEIGHHDPITDVFSLGLLLASLSCGLDLNDPRQLQTFVESRRNLFRLQPKIHPVLAKAVMRMTELRRSDRPQDLGGVLRTLENHGDQAVDFETDLARVDGFLERDLQGKRQVLLGTLQQRLFEISRRNRLLVFRQSGQTVNLTQASVPLSFNIQNIRPEKLLTWSPDFQKELVGSGRLDLNRYLRFTEALYLPSVLDRIRSESRRDRAEFGFAQLRLVACFLRWWNLKETPPERYNSPLVLVPVRLEKRKGIRDSYRLRVLDSEAEVNPVLRHYLETLYGIELPEAIDLATTDLRSLYDFLASRIQASEPGVTLNCIDRPRVDILHDRARRRLDQYRRRLSLSGRGVNTFLDIDYSYAPGNYSPLGVQVFQTRIRAGGTRLRALVEERPRPRTFAAEPGRPQGPRERVLYSLRDEEDDNPYMWDFDLCGVTLGNFRYRKMSLVRDYDALLEGETPCPAFDAVFSLAPRPLAASDSCSVDLEERFHVVACDPTQAAAVARAARGDSLIIQGPPGTGKSQTIVNLIADCVARSRRVLFVCEKRAALDVVYHRLRQQGLDDLCCLIHDSQDDKKAFIHDLKVCYERLLETRGEGGEPSRAERKKVLAALRRELRPLRRFDETMREEPEGLGVSLLGLLRRTVELRASLPDLEALQKERLPDYEQWERSRERIVRLAELLAEVQDDAVYLHHPLCRVRPRVIEEDRPVEFVLEHVEAARGLLRRIESVLGGIEPPLAGSETLQEVSALADHAAALRPFAEAGTLPVLDPASSASRELERLAARQKTLAAALQTAREGTSRWREKLPAGETVIAIQEARRLQGLLLPFLRPSWWRLRRVLRNRYDLRSHTVRPSWTQILEGLDEEYRAEAAFQEGEREARETFHFSTDTARFARRVESLRERAARLDGPALGFHRACLRSPDAGVVQEVAALQETFRVLKDELGAFLTDPGDGTVQALRDTLRSVEESIDLLPDFLPCLEELAGLPPEIRMAFRAFALDAAGLESASIQLELERIYLRDRSLRRFTGRTRDRHLARIEKLYRELLDVNSRVVLERSRARFLENVRLASLPADQLAPEQREFKKAYTRGRRELEHEFGKTMRYKPIRSLAAGDTGLVIRDLKPVWLMSPLSVSDTLPLDTKFFDLVVFDEASQITLEEAVPTLFRAGQTIVVGDRMQLPPTNFFSARRGDEERLSFEEGGETVEYDLDSNSFLTHSSRNLPSTMLGWHYRSRFESLISFSNAAFYQGSLLTVPERELAADGREEIRVLDPEEGRGNVGALLERPLSFHFVEGGLYSKRRNAKEAAYIASLVQGLLAGGRGLSIGIVAFSEAQQDEIENALERLARKDREFGALLEEEYERERDDQFVGLLVKNLENIQGDERDVVILSVCYGRAPDGKIRMNFGPINQSGGEKRLNVAFTRAKQHMVLVSSIRHADITNDYNDGAACLKSYLRYAEAVSSGDLRAIRSVLGDVVLSGDTGPAVEDARKEPAVEQIAAALRARGYRVDTRVGHSQFRCDLAVRREGDRRYRAGILLDTREHYAREDILARDMMQPALLRSFGWRIAPVLTKDWLEDPEKVLAGIDELVRGDSPEARGEAAG